MAPRVSHRHIRVSDEVFEQLRALAQPGETPDTVLRRALGLPPVAQGRRSNILKPVRGDQ